MTILSAQTIRMISLQGAPRFRGFSLSEPVQYHKLIEPFMERYQHGSGMSGGLSSCGYDVHLHDELAHIPGAQMGGSDRGGDLTRGEYLRIPPRTLVLAATVEKFDLPQDLCMRVMDKSSWIRRGLAVHNTIAEPYWRGHLTLELENKSYSEILVLPGTPIAQCVFERLDEPTMHPYAETGKYQDQEAGPQQSRSV